MSKSVLHLNLHSIAKNGQALGAALEELLAEAEDWRAKRAEIIPGKGETVWGTVARPFVLFLEPVNRNFQKVYSFCKKMGNS